MSDLTNKSIAFIGQKGIPKDFPGTSGIEAYTQSLAFELLKQKNSITCYIREWAKTYPGNLFSGIKLIVLPSINTVHLDALSHSFLASLHASFIRYDIVWYQGMGPAVFAFIPRLFGKRVYTTIHSLDWQRRKWGWFGQIFLKFCERVVFLTSDRIYVVSVSLRNYYENKYGVRVFLKRYRIQEERGTAPTIISKKFRLQKDGYILFLGRFVPEKRLEWLIRSAPRVTCPVVLAGGSSHTDRYADSLRLLAKNKNVIFPNYVFGREKKELISNCRLMVLPSSLEGYPVSVTEALGYGKKCLVGNYLKKEFGDNKLVNYFNPDNYADFLHQLLSLTG